MLCQRRSVVSDPEHELGTGSCVRDGGLCWSQYTVLGTGSCVRDGGLRWSRYAVSETGSCVRDGLLFQIRSMCQGRDPVSETVCCVRDRDLGQRRDPVSETVACVGAGMLCQRGTWGRDGIGCQRRGVCQCVSGVEWSAQAHEGGSAHPQSHTRSTPVSLSLTRSCVNFTCNARSKEGLHVHESDLLTMRMAKHAMEQGHLHWTRFRFGLHVDRTTTLAGD